MAGTVEAVGANVTRFKAGDEVFGGVQRRTRGIRRRDARTATIVAEARRSLSSRKPPAIPIAAVTALQALRDHGHIAAGQKVLINGASGGVGTYAVQIAKALGAEVTAVCSTRNVELVRSLGADHVIDYTKARFHRRRRAVRPHRRQRRQSRLLRSQTRGETGRHHRHRQRAEEESVPRAHERVISSRQCWRLRRPAARVLRRGRDTSRTSKFSPA